MVAPTSRIISIGHGTALNRKMLRFLLYTQNIMFLWLTPVEMTENRYMCSSGAQGEGHCNFPEIIIFSPRKDGFSLVHLKIYRILVT